MTGASTYGLLLQSTWRVFSVDILGSTSCVELKFLVNIPIGVIDTNLVSGCKCMLVTADWVLVVPVAQIVNFYLISLVLTV